MSGKPKTGDDGNRANSERLANKDEILQVLQRGSEVFEDLLAENERLRYRVAEFEASQQGSDSGLVRELLEKVSRLEGEKADLQRRYTRAEEETRDHLARFKEIETENHNLLNVYVASYQLHSTLDFDEILRIIAEILLNFVGADQFAVAMLDRDGLTLHPLVVEQTDSEAVGNINVHGGVVAEVLRTGRPYFAAAEVQRTSPVNEPAACVPLRIKGDTLGLILVYRFLPQKDTLATVDHDIFALLADHAATALFSARMYGDTQRKLQTIQSLIGLVTSE